MRATDSSALNVLVVGSGGREHALAWKMAQSPRVRQILVAPGNAGTAQMPGARNVPVKAEDTSGLLALAHQEAVNLVLVGPEAPLAAGLADAFAAMGVPAFGPGRAAAEIESSKAFAKGFMARHAIPTARFAVCSDFRSALSHLMAVDYPVVIKASGLAAGKGVIVPDCPGDTEAALRQMLVEHAFGQAGETVVIEERLEGPEISVMAFSDGRTVIPMVPAQDHKRLLDGDQGPNTGGMGAYAPVSLCPPAVVDEIVQAILQPTIDGLAAEGRPYRGVLYAGLMLTGDGPKVLEFNCRFGDPETQVVLPLLESDLLSIAEACVQGRLVEADIHWRGGAAACVVMASAGYPGSYRSGLPIHGLEQASELPGVRVFHAGTGQRGGETVTAGGRVLNVVGLGTDLAEALEWAYQGVQRIQFDGAEWRTDIGWRALAR